MYRWVLMIVAVLLSLSPLSARADQQSDLDRMRELLKIPKGKRVATLLVSGECSLAGTYEHSYQVKTFPGDRVALYCEGEAFRENAKVSCLWKSTATGSWEKSMKRAMRRGDILKYLRSRGWEDVNKNLRGVTFPGTVSISYGMVFLHWTSDPFKEEDHGHGVLVSGSPVKNGQAHGYLVKTCVVQGFSTVR